MSLDLLYSPRLKRRHDLLLFCRAARAPSPGGQTQTPPQVTRNKEQSAPVETVDTTQRVPRVDNKREREKEKTLHLFSQARFNIAL